MEGRGSRLKYPPALAYVDRRILFVSMISLSCEINSLHGITKNAKMIA